MSSKYRTIREAKRAEPERYKLKKGPLGRNLCRFCSVEVKPPRITFCSGEMTLYSRRKINGIWTRVVCRQGFGCVHQYLIRSRSRYARDAVFDRDGGKCAHCGIQHGRKGPWQADHIVPVVEGGGLCGLENLRTLCTGCHKTVTAELRTRLKNERNRIKEESRRSAEKVSGMETTPRRRKKKTG